MFNMKKAIAFLLALIMVFSCMPVSLAEGKDDKNQVMDTFQNKEVVLVENEGESEEPEKAESLELSSEDLSVTQLSEKRLEELKGLLPVSEEKDGEASGQKGGSAGPRRGAKLLRASQPVTRTSTGFAAFEISPVNLENEAEQYVVNVSLGNPIDLLDDEDAIINSVAFELYHIHTDEKDNTEVDKYTEETGLDVECENDQITGFSFSTPDFSEFVLKYTVVFHFEDKTFEQREIPGAKDIPLAEILTGLEIVSAEDAEAFMAELAVEVSDYGVIQLGFDDRGSWTFRVLKETEEPASLILTKQNGQKYIISVSATGNTELATEDNSAVIHTVNDYYLPEEAEIYAASLTDEKDDAAIAAVQNLTGGKKEEDEEEKTGYQAFSIGLNAVNTNEYEGFDVEVRLTEELSGRDFRLYEVKNGEAKEIKDIQLTANTRSDGSQDVQGFSFTTNGFADYVLCYSLVTYYTTASGETYEITLNYGKEAGIPGGAELKVSELQKDSEEYNEHLEEAAEKLGVSSEDLTFARFFDIEIWAENKQIQPKAPVEVTIALADMPETENAVIDVVHFGKDGVAVVEAETEEGICFDADSFSVYGIIAVSSLPQGVEGLDGYSVKISNQGYYVGSGVITDVTPSRISKTNSEKDAAVWSFEAAGTSGDYYLATMVNTGTEENKNYVKKYLTFSHYDVDRWENHRAHAFLSDTPQQAFTVSKNGNDYRIGTSIDGIPYYLNQFDGTDGVGFAGYEYADASQAQLSIKFTQPVYQTGHNYAVIIEHNNAYYAVMNDGSLQEVVYNATNNTVEMEYPIFWTYSSEEVTREITNGAYAGPVTNLRIKAEATGYDANQLASGVYYRYFAPETDSGIIEEPKISDNPTNEEVSEQHLRYVWNNAIRYENNHIKGLNKYIGVDENALKICGNIESADQAAVVYLAEVINVLPGGTGTANNETVNHIDIAIVGTGFLDVPLAYGTYYDAYKNQVVTVTSETPVTLHLKKDVDIDKYDIMRASVHAYDKNGNELNDAFYITGYTSNARTDHSAVQVRMEGSFKVDTLDPYVGGNSNLDEDRMAERKQNQVYYTVSTIKNVEFELEYPDPNNPNQTIKLYDEKGNPLKVKAKVRMSAGFSYWDENNECPPLQDDFEEKYSWLYNDLEERNIHIEKGYNNSYWEKGAIIDNTWGYPYFRGESGMDFVLGSKDDADGKTVAIEIVKIIEDENGSYLHPSTDIRSDFSVYYNSDKSAQEKVYGLGNPGSIDSNNAGLANSHSGYNPLRNEYILVGEDGIGVLYDYNVSEGMFYIEEDSSSMAAGGANAVITDIEGLKWAYVRTSTETEYVWRNDGKSGRHIVNGYSSVPEILGDYTDVAGSDVGTDGKKLRNGFLEFYVRNIYKLKTSNLQISKTIVSPVPTDSTNKEFTFTVKVTKPNKDKTPLTGEFVGETYDKNGVKIETKNYIFNENGETTVTTTGNQTVKIIGLPEGVSYVVTEAADNDFDLDETHTTGTSGTLGADGATAAFTNIRKTGSLVITKSVQGNGSDEAPSGSYDYPIKVTTTIGTAKYYVEKKTDGTFALTTEDVSFNVTNGTTLTLTDLPVSNGGTALKYKVEEVNPGSIVIAGYTNVEVDETVKSVDNIEVGGETGGSAALKNVYKLTRLTISKAMNVGTSTASFSFTVEVKNGETAYNGTAWLDAGKEHPISFENGIYTATVQAGSSVTIYGIPAGYTYKVTENNKAGFLLVSVDKDTSKTESAGTISGTESTAAFVNKEVVSVSVDKTWLNSDNSDLIWPTGVEVTVALMKGTTPERSCILTGEEGHRSYTFTNLDKYDANNNEIAYTVAETGVTFTDKNNYVVSVTGDAASGFHITNKLKPGALTITKSVTVDSNPISTTDNTGRKNLADGVYSFSITGPNDYSSSGAITVTDGFATSTIILSDLVPGVYTITEGATTNGTTLSGRSGGTNDGNASIKINVIPGSTADVNVVAFTNNINTTNLIISKEVVSTILADSTKTFTFTVQVTKAGGTPLTGTFGDYTFDSAGKTTVITTGTESKTIPGLPQGATYSVTESTDNEFEQTVLTGETTGTLGTTNASESFKNTRKTGKLKISKAIQTTDPDGTISGTPSYNVKVSVDINGTTYYIQDTNGTLGTVAPTIPLSVTAGSSLEIDKLPIKYNGKTLLYKVEEIEPDKVEVTSFTNVTVNETVESVENITVNETTVAEANLVNVYERDKGSLGIVKTVSVNGTATQNTDLVDGTYYFTVESNETKPNEQNEQVPVTTKTLAITLTNGVITSVTGDGKLVTYTENNVEKTKAVVTGLPTGKYKVTEAADQTGRGITFTATDNTNIDVTENNEANIPTASFVNNVDVGDLEISKIAKVGTVVASTLNDNDSRKNLADGVYTFRVYKTYTSDTNNVVATKANGKRVEDVTVEIEDGAVVNKAVVKDLVPGTYYVKEISGTNTAVELDTRLFTVNVIKDQTVKTYVSDEEATPTNVLPVGSLKVTKTIQSTTEGDSITTTSSYDIIISTVINGTTYYVQNDSGVLGTEAPETSLSVTAESELLISNLPFGDYIVREKDPGSVLISGYSFTIVPNTSKSSVTVNVNNSNTSATANVGNLVNVYIKDTWWTPVIGKLLNKKNYAGEEFTFRATIKGQSSYLQEVGSTADGTVSFTPIKYTATQVEAETDRTKEFYYTITEVEGTDPFIDYDAKTIYAKVVVKLDSNSVLSAVGTYYSDEACTQKLETPTFNNTELGNLDVTKTVTGSYTPEANETYRVTVKYGDQYVTAEPKPETTSTYTYTGLGSETVYNIKKDETLHFERLPVGEYTVTEETVSKDGYVITTTYKVDGSSTAVEVAPKVEVKKPQTTTDGESTTTYLPAKVEIENHYRDAQLVITKSISGVDVPTAAALITIKVVDGEGHVLLNNVKLTEAPFVRSVTEPNKYIATLKSTDTGDNAAYALYLVPDGKYTVTETVTEPTGYSLKSSQYAVTAKSNVAATDAVSGNGYTFQLKETDTSTGEIDYTNVYERDKGSLAIAKTVTVNGETIPNTDLVDGTYSFTVVSEETAANDQNEQVPVTTKHVTVTLKNGAITAASNADDAQATDVGIVTSGGKTKAVVSGLPTGTYTVTEVLTDDQKDNKHITFTPEDGASVDVTKGNESNVPTASLNNNIEVGSLKITKIAKIGETEASELTDSRKTLADGTYTFRVYTNEEGTEPAKKANGSAIPDAEVVIRDGAVVEPAEVTDLLPGTYYVKEIGPQNTAVTLDNEAHEVTVTARQIGQTVAAGATATATNVLPVGNLMISKTIQSTSENDTIPITAGEEPSYPVIITVKLKNTDYYVQNVSGELGTEAPETSLEVKAGKKLTISNLPYGNYTVTESNPGNVRVDGYCYVNVENTSHPSGSDEVDEDGGKVDLVNVYTKDTLWTPQVSKQLSGKTYSGSDFSFVLTDITDSQNSKEVQTITNVNEGTVSFDAIYYTVNDVGNSPFMYKIAEASGNDEYIVYDTTPIFAKVTLTNDSGTLRVDGKYYSDDACTKELTTPTIRNTELGSLDVTKAVSGSYTAASTDEYPVTIKCGSKYVTATQDGTTTTYTYAELSESETVYYVKAGDAETLHFVKLPVGEYTVTEGSVSKTGYGITTTYKVDGSAVATAVATVVKTELDSNGVDTKAKKVEIDNKYRDAELIITKKISGVDVPTAAALITIKVVDSQDHVLLNDVVLTDARWFAHTDGTDVYTATLKSTDTKVTDGDTILYAPEYLVPDGVYTVTETIVEPDHYSLKSSKYAVTALTNVSKTDAASGTGYTFQLTGIDTSTGEIDYTNEYEQPEPPHKQETSVTHGTETLTEGYTGIGPLGGVHVGDLITYEITYRNYKAGTADIIVTDTLDENVTLESADTTGAGGTEVTTTTSNDEKVITWTVKDVPKDGTGKIKLTVKVLASAQAPAGPGKVDNGGNDATVKVGNDSEYKLEYVENPVPENPHKQEIGASHNGTPYTGDAYVGIGERGGVKVGDEITYEIKYKNYKTKAATVVIKDTLDPYVTFVSATDDSMTEGTEKTWNVANGVVTWTIANVAAGKEGRVTLTVKVLPGAQAPAGPGKVDNGGSDATVKVGNDTEYELEYVENPVPENPHKQETGIIHNGTTITDGYTGNGTLGGVHVGDLITYEITYKNYKTETANIVVTDTLDKNVKFASADTSNAGGSSVEISDATNTNGEKVITWTVKDVPKGGTGSIKLTVEVLPSACETYTDADGKVQHGPGKVDNGGGDATVKVGNDSNYELDYVENPVPENPHKQETGVNHNGTTLTDGYTGNGTLGGVHVGDLITYEITYKNYKTEIANIVVTDTLDKNVVFASADTSNAGGSSVETSDATNAKGEKVITWTVKDVPMGETGSIKLTVKVLESACETYTDADGNVQHGPGKVDNGGDDATVKVGNDSAFTLEYVENPVPENPHKQETGVNHNGTTLTEGYTGNGTLGGVHVGDLITYEITYKNYKAGTADIVVTDTLDKNVRFASADTSNAGGSSVETSDATNTNGEKVITWTVKDVPKGGTGSIKQTVEVLESACETYTDADGKVQHGPGKVDNGGDDATVKVGNDSAFTLEYVENPVPENPHKQETGVNHNGTTLTEGYTGNGKLGGVQAGDLITYEITYKNYKAGTANIVVTDTLDVNVAFESADTTGAGGTAVTSEIAVNGKGETVITWMVKDVPADGKGSIKLTVKVLESAQAPDGPGKVDNGGDDATVKVGNDSAFTLEYVENPVPENPHKQETGIIHNGTTITEGYTGNGALGGVHVGDLITYEITYTNYKAETADIVVTDTLDVNVAFETADTSNAGGTQVGTSEATNAKGEKVITWTVKDVPADGTGSIKLTVKVLESAQAPDGPGKVDNGGDDATVKVGNDSAFTLEYVENPVPEEPHKKETDPYEGTGVLGGVKVGDEITYEISFRNYKTDAATVTIKDTLDKNVEFVSASDGGKEAGGIVTWTLTEVPAGEKGKVTLTVKVLEGALKSKGGEGKVVNGGDSTTVKVGNDNEYTVETVENPVPEEPEKKEITPYEGTGLLGNVRIGDIITYKISYRNYKTEAADVLIKDTLDKNVAFESASDGGALANGIVTWTMKNVEAGKSGSVTLSVKVLPGALISNGGTGSVINGGDTATVKVGNDNEFTLNEVENPVPEKRETAPYKGTGLLGNVHVGDEITYEITYRNYKTEAADVVIKDKLDKNVAFVSASDGGVNNGGTVNWTLSAVPAGKAGTVTLKVKVLPGALVSNGGTGSVINDGDTATVKVGNDNEFTLNTVENPVPEKRETAPYKGTGLLGFVKVGDEITYELSYRNYKTEAADVVIKDKLDKNVEFVSASDGGALADGVVTWTLKSVPAGKAGVVTLKVKVLEGALVSNGGTGSVINNGDTATVKVGNDSEFALNTVENPIPEKREIDPYVGNGLLGPVDVGDLITYEISYRNYKTEAATVTIKDKLDVNAEFVSASNGGTLSNGTVTWTLANVPAGEAGTVTLTIRVLPGARVSNGGPGSVINNGDTATVQVGNDSEYTLNTAENPVPEEPQTPSKKEIEPYEGNGVLGQVNVGDLITYQIDFFNYKTDAADVVVKDRLDVNAEFVSASNGGTLSDGTVTWTLAGVAARTAGTVTLTIRVLPGALVSNGGPGKVINNGDTATVKIGNDDEITLDTVENPVNEEPSGPSKKEVSPYEGNGVLGRVNVGDIITYEITYRNYKAEAANVVIKDQLDANVAFVSASDGGVNNGGVVNWTLANVAADAEGKVTLKVQVLSGALVSNGGLGKVVNGGETATVKVGNDNEVSLETVENPVTEEPRIPQKRETSPYEGTGVLGAVNVGEVITYEISYQNYKTEAADIVIRDKLDANVAFVSADNGGVNNSGTVTWTLRNVPAGREGKVTLKVSVLEGALVSKGGPGKVVNGGETATVKVGNDNEVSLSTIENPVPEEPSGEFSGPEKREIAPFTGTGVLGAVKVGDTITYEITYRNYKAAPATIVIRDQLDKNADFVSADNGGIHTRGVVTWTLRNVPAGSEGKVTLTVKVLEGALTSKDGPGKVVNGGETATVKVGNDAEVTLNTVENPVNEEQKKPDNKPNNKPNNNKPNNKPDNKPEGKTVSVTVRKEWDDNNNEKGRRPSHVRVTLSNGRSYILSPRNGWSVTVDNLPAERGGQPITYTWTEQSVPGYVQTENRTEDGVTVLVNQYREVLLPTLPGRKKTGKRPIILDEYETPLGVQVIINHVGDCYE